MSLAPPPAANRSTWTKTFEPLFVNLIITKQKGYPKGYPFCLARKERLAVLRTAEFAPQINPIICPLLLRLRRTARHGRKRSSLSLIIYTTRKADKTKVLSAFLARKERLAVLRTAEFASQINSIICPSRSACGEPSQDGRIRVRVSPRTTEQSDLSN